MKHLILGGARSGKSRFAETCAQATGKECVYIATGEARDEEMAQRIRAHQQARKHHWHTIEEPLYLSQVLNQATAQQAVVIDCLTLWLANCLEKQCFPEQKTHLLEALNTTPACVFLVSNEVGSGIVPLGPLTREFVDQAGWLHQSLAAQCNKVSLVVAGLALDLKPTPSPTTAVAGIKP